LSELAIQNRLTIYTSLLSRHCFLVVKRSNYCIKLAMKNRSIVIVNFVVNYLVQVNYQYRL